MLGEGGTALSELLDAIRKFQAREDRRVDLKRLRVVIDALKVELASIEDRAGQGRLPSPANSTGSDRSS
jgi:hypothetical protein